MPKVAAFTAGRRGGNCEIYVKIALEELTKMCIECELIRLHECDLRPCLDCNNGPCIRAEDGPCTDGSAWDS